MARSKDCTVVWGGIHSSLLSEETVSHPLVDYVVQGEGEYTFAELVDALAEGSRISDIAGLWYKADGAAAFTHKKELLELDKLPPVPYDIVDFSRYIKKGPYGMSIVLYSSRGCPQRCTFCANPPYNRSRWRAFSSERIMGDIARLRKKYPTIRHIQFWDDNFFASLSRGMEIAEGIARMEGSLSWSVIGSHVRDLIRMDGAYLDNLRKSRLKDVLIGVESGSERMLSVVQKNFGVEELFEVNKRLGDHGIRATYSFVSGLPGEEDEDLRKTIDVMFRLKNENPKVITGNVKPFICYPGTVLYKQAVESGFRPPRRLEDWSEFVWGNYLNLEISLVPKKRKRFLTWLYYYTILMCPEYIFIRNPFFRAIATALRPIARWRVRRLCLQFPVEAWLMSVTQRFLL
jgi:anaerobic magnesium-protoporphyrin IX monomethyl ester cyclase